MEQFSYESFLSMWRILYINIIQQANILLEFFHLFVK